MKNNIGFQIHFLAALLLLILVLPTNNLSAQSTNNDLRAIVANGKITIRVNSASIFNNYFVKDGNGQVDLSLYFGPEDPRNGQYYTGPVMQPNGQVYLSFAEIPYTQGDTMTFIATEILGTSTVKNYVFIRGDFFPESGGPINTCPVSISCSQYNIYLNFGPSVIIDQSSLTDIAIFSPGLLNNTYYTTANMFPALDFHAIGLSQPSSNSSYVDCEAIMSSEVVVMMNGLTCIFQNGQLVSSGNCSPFSDYYSGNTGCAGMIESCAPEIIHLLSDVRYTVSCKQWIDYNMCSTTKHIKRLGKVAIGTAGFSAANLTVKNGIITDKVKVTANGWADYVFDKDYPLMPLEQVDAYIQQFHHLPDTPSAAQVEADGSFELGATTLNHQAKIEEIFLHLINLEEETKGLESVLFLQEALNKIRIN